MLTADSYTEVETYKLRDRHEMELGTFTSFDNALRNWVDGCTIYDCHGVPIYPDKEEILTVLKKGDKGSKVKALQLLLIGYGYELNPFGADGNFSQLVEDKVKEFQSSVGLEAVGIVNIETWKELLGG